MGLGLLFYILLEERGAPGKLPSGRTRRNQGVTRALQGTWRLV